MQIFFGPFRIIDLQKIINLECLTKKSGTKIP